MKHPTAPRKHRNHAKGKQRNSYIPSYSLEEIFVDENSIADKCRLARYYIVQAFLHAKMESINGRSYGTDRRIVKVGPKQSELVRHVLSAMDTRIVLVSDLSDKIRDKHPIGAQRKIATNASWLLVAYEVAALVNSGSIWFNQQVPGCWEISPSVVDSCRTKQVEALAYKAKQTARRDRLHGGRLAVVH